MIKLPNIENPEDLRAVIEKQVGTMSTSDRLKKLIIENIEKWTLRFAMSLRPCSSASV